MQVFEKVVSEGGFAAAARALDLSPTVVSRLVNDLEEHLGTRLIQRTTRKLALTESGNIYLSKLSGILQEVSDAEDAAQNSAGRLSGALHVLTTPLLASYFLAPLAYAWRTRHPQVLLDISVDPFSHLRVEEFDLTLMAVEEGYDADTVARVLGRTESILCAAPSYLQRAGVPVQPSDLHQHDQLKFPWQKAPGHSSGHGIRLTHVAGLSEPVDVQMHVVLQSLCLDVLVQAALAGAGLCLLSVHLAQPHLCNGSLVHVLRDWQAGSLTVYAALPTRKFVPARVAAMLDFVTEAAQQVFPGVAP
jgi:DNA-binding transcriptional LysR family regulator